MDFRSLPPPAACKSSSSCRYASSESGPSVSSRSVTAASIKKTYMREPHMASRSSEWPTSSVD
eukprot:741764-Prymnesium_polylepis.1